MSNTLTQHKAQNYIKWNNKMTVCEKHNILQKMGKQDSIINKRKAKVSKCAKKISIIKVNQFHSPDN